MILDKKEATVGYFCPSCGSGVVSMVGVFTLSGDMLRLKCPCQQSALRLTRTGGSGTDRKIRLEVPCFVCPNTHPFQISESAFFEQELLCLPCGMSGFDACFIGSAEKVSAAMSETEKQILCSLSEAGLDVGDAVHLTQIADRELHIEKSAFGGDGDFERNTNFDDNHIVDLVLFVIRDMMDGGDVVCRCPGCLAEQGISAELAEPKQADGVPDSEKYQIRMDADGVTVTCRDCGASRTIACNSSMDANAFLECERLYLD